jgi:hypothetical protein
MVDASLTGNLSAFRLPEVLTFLSMTRKNGTLTLVHGAKEVGLVFASGSLVYASSNEERFRLGSILLRKKRITPEQQSRIDALMRSDGGRFGERGLQEGLFTEEQLRDFLKIQVSEIVYDCFGWDGGAFSFHQDAKLPEYAVTITIDLANLIMEGARRISERERCERLFPDRNAVFRVVAIPKDEKVTLSADEWRILFTVNGQRTVEELAADAEDPFQVYRLLYGLLANRLIEPVAPVPVVPDDTRSTRAIAAQQADAQPMTAESTFRQGAPKFGGVSTMRDVEDDTNLLVASDARLSYADVVRPTIAQFTVANGDLVGRVIPLTETEYSIGRQRDNTIQIVDLGISGLHARLFRGAEGYVLEDLKSRNGTWVNSSLKHGDRVHVGTTDLVYEVLM